MPDELSRRLKERFALEAKVGLLAICGWMVRVAGLGNASELFSPCKDRIKHVFAQPSSESILLARVIAAQKCPALL